MRWRDLARNKWPWLLLAAAVVATAAVYWPGLPGGWVFDDYPNIVDNRGIHITPGHSSLGAWINAALSSPASFLHRPLASITFALNWYFGGGDPWPFKLTNVIIHLLNGVLLFCMLRVLLRLLNLRRFDNRAQARSYENQGHRFGARDLRRSRPAGEPNGDDATPGADTPRVPEPSPPTPLPGGEGRQADTSSPPLSRRERGAHSPAAAHADTRGWIDEAAANRLALAVSAAWMLLPINLMAVLYVVQRMESLCQVLVLAGLWAYLQGRWMMRTATDARRDRYGLAVAAAGIVLGTLLGLTSKESAVLLPVYAFLAEAVLLRFRSAPAGILPYLRYNAAIPSPPPSGGRGIEGDGRSLPRTDKRIWALFTVTLFVPAVLGFAWLLRGALNPAAWSGRAFTLVQRLMTEPRILVDYLHWTILPNPMVLSLYHDEITISTGWLTPWTTLPAMLLLAALIVIAVLLRNRRPLVALGIGWFFAAQLLTATIVPLELVYEQRMYFGSIGVLLALGSLLLGLRWRIHWPLLRGTLVVLALAWYASATTLRAREWSSPLRLAVAEADRHPESARAVYEAGRRLLMQSNYREGAFLVESAKYLRQAAAIPGSSTLAEQALIMIVDHNHHGDDETYWASMAKKLRSQPTRQEDISALISLTSCYGAGICRFDLDDLQRAFEAALSRPNPAPRLNAAYSTFQRNLRHNDALAIEYLARASRGDPNEPAYHIDLAALYARNGETAKALEQIDALRRMNLGGRLDSQIERLERSVGQPR